jgi:hypothetical protein
MAMPIIIGKEKRNEHKDGGETRREEKGVEGREDRSARTRSSIPPANSSMRSPEPAGRWLLAWRREEVTNEDVYCTPESSHPKEIHEK